MFLKPLLPEAEAGGVPVEDLQYTPFLVAKEVERPVLEGTLLKLLLHHDR